MKTITQSWNHYILHGHWDNNARKDYENLVGTEHADELSIVQPSYKTLEWLSGNQARAIKEVEVSEVTDLDQELNFD